MGTSVDHTDHDPRWLEVAANQLNLGDSLRLRYCLHSVPARIYSPLANNLQVSFDSSSDKTVAKHLCFELLALSLHRYIFIGH